MCKIKYQYDTSIYIDKLTLLSGEVVELPNPIRFVGETTYILLNHDKEAIVYSFDYFDKEIYKIHLRQSDYNNPAGDYAVTDIRDSNTKTGRNTLSLHEIILGEIPGLVIDHINGDHFDCRRWNLRHGTTAQNNSNRHMLSPEDCYLHNPDRNFSHTVVLFNI